MREISFEEVLKLKNYVLIDARSPKEFLEQGIPGAVNIPALLDDERAEVGTAYVKQSKEKAKEIGIQRISKRLPEIFKNINELSKKYDRLIFYCSRGGMRSGSLEVLFNTLGFKTMKLQGGYKSYRQYILENIHEINKNKEYIVLHGRTGEGKTKILEKLEEKGYSVLNLEKMADHKGSFFGGVCETREQSQKRFDGEIFNRLIKDTKGYFLVESESKRIGNIYINENIYSSIVNGKHLFVSTSMKNRVEIIMEDYADAKISELEECLLKVARYISKERYEKYHSLLIEGKLAELSEILMEKYYDPLYDVGINKYTYDVNINYEDVDEAVEEIVTYLKNNNYEE
ncbi:tRNA 2-selenouridine(34) synthase MnmH [Fusobacterium sp. IOR10]|uniref:tRNA 2-selenouridine(34) synthase MnmH n=1 Tax=Fusobacterium sp. IOR10 TaxID=2665157 RepID=UPI0013D6CDB4|nr:tRNA 2-selenouridine(34) synthase MnmH [Fusobacterium sp. IOR10]